MFHQQLLVLFLCKKKGVNCKSGWRVRWGGGGCDDDGDDDDRQMRGRRNRVVLVRL